MENDYLERIVALEMERKSSDREIKELKEKVDNLSILFNGQALTSQDILNKVNNLSENFNLKFDNLSKEFTSFNKFIDDLKEQPKKELNKFKWIVISALSGSAITALVTIVISKFVKI